MKRKILFTFIITFIGLNAFSQTTVKIIDFSLMPLIPVNATPIDSVELMVMFKINQPSDASKAHLWLGTAPESSDIMAVTAVFSTAGNVSSILYNGQSNEIINYLVFFKVKIAPMSFDNNLKAALFVETNSGQFTPHLQF